MATPFITRKPTPQETALFQLAMSSFCDGSGQEREEDGTTRPGWRDLERIVAEVLHGTNPENKDVFDVVFPSNDNKDCDYGISIKSKQLSASDAINRLSTTGRVHMELSNSPAKFWSALRAKGIQEEDFRERRRSTEVGNIVLDVVRGWHDEAKQKYETEHPGRNLDLSNSIYLTISYGKATKEDRRRYQMHSFELNFPTNITWKYISEKCLRGYDPAYPDETLVDWYGLSGGQLKYYPRASTAHFSTEPFQLLLPKMVSISEKSSVYWPKEWTDAGGDINPILENVIEAKLEKD
jgi:hypothetical protein